MYCVTNVEMSVKALIASQNFNCMHCEPGHQENAILQGEKFFFINGFRTYERVFYEEEGNRTIKRLGLFIPYSVRWEKKIYGNPAEFKHFIDDRKICVDCFNHFQRFMRTSNRLQAGETIEFNFRHTKRRIMQCKYDYFCRTCGDPIPQDSSYTRFGYHECHCNKCVAKVEKIIGAEYCS